MIALLVLALAHTIAHPTASLYVDEPTVLRIGHRGTVDADWLQFAADLVSDKLFRDDSADDTACCWTMIYQQDQIRTVTDGEIQHCSTLSQENWDDCKFKLVELNSIVVVDQIAEPGCGAGTNFCALQDPSTGDHVFLISRNGSAYRDPYWLGHLLLIGVAVVERALTCSGDSCSVTDSIWQPDSVDYAFAMNKLRFSPGTAYMKRVREQQCYGLIGGTPRTASRYLECRCHPPVPIAFDLALPGALMPALCDPDGTTCNRGVCDGKEQDPICYYRGGDFNGDGTCDWDEEPSFLCGDVDEDGKVSVADMVEINLSIFGVKPVSSRCDGNGDGRCDVADIVAANSAIFGSQLSCN